MENKLKNMIIVGGSHRQSGKTDVACQIIKKLVKKGSVVCLKVCCHDPSDARDLKADFTLDDYWLVKEEPSEGTKSTDKMYAIGASAVYRLIVMKDALQEAFKLFLEEVEQDKMVVCESNSLRELVEPAMFVFVDKKSEDKEKYSSARVRKFADVIIKNDGVKLSPSPEKIKIPDLKKNIKEAEAE